MIDPPYAPEQQHHPAPSIPLASAPIRILVVDDDQSLLETISDLLEVAGFLPIKAANAAEALTILQQEERIDALITDLAMPGVDGVALIHQAQKIRAGLPALLLTGYTDLTCSATAAANSGFHILRKPVESQRLIKKLESLVSSAANP